MTPPLSSPLKKEFLDKKLRLVQDTMKQQEIDLWITFTREGNEDPLAPDLRFDNITWRSAALIDRNLNKTALVGSLEEEAIKQRGFYDQVIPYASEGASPKLKQIIARMKPKKIALNKSYDEGAADGLTSSMEAYLKKALQGIKTEYVSSEDLAIALRARLIPEEVNLVKRAIQECEKVYDEIETIIRPGKKDRDIFQYAHQLVDQRNLEYAWAKDHCPSVVVGNSPAGHVAYYGDTIHKGDFVRLDFGVKYQGYCSDIQRNYIVGPTTIPAGVKKMFQVAREANDIALKNLKPGVQGYKIDQLARSHITKNGFAEYKHALGHVLGRSTHEIGPLLGPRWSNRYGNQPMKTVMKDLVFTIEPSVTSRYGTCNLEQDVLVTTNSYRDLSKPQTELIMVG
ncbi:MAG TPA: M24 family metallopeptidase [Candidatus Binatus sp.]|nr:M24 family metallopeptidase [Candidatus Binatus sp.]